ncbi:MAG: hypothetical protein ABIG44_12585 [Planctomycetota bacterium]
MLGLVDDYAQLDGRQEAGVLGVLMLNAPDPDGTGIEDASLESLLRHGTLAEEIEDVGGRPCYVVEAVFEGLHYATIWLDAERDLLPVKKVVYGRDGSEASVVVVNEAVTFEETWSGETLWVPTQWEAQIRIGGELLRRSFTVDAESIVVNPEVEENEFRIDFPPGTTVMDRVAGLTYTISESGEAVEVVGEDLARVQADLEAQLSLPAEKRGTNARERPQRMSRTAPPVPDQDRISAPLPDGQSASEDGAGSGSRPALTTRAAAGVDESPQVAETRPATSSGQNAEVSRSYDTHTPPAGQAIATPATDGPVVPAPQPAANLMLWLVPPLILVALALLIVYARFQWRKASGRTHSEPR